MRHRIANALYSAAAWMDRPTHKLAAGGDSLEFGDYRNSGHWADRTLDSGSLGLHTRPDTPVSAHFKPGDYVYAALHVGRGASVTVYLSRTITLRLINVLRGVDEAFREYGEGKS